QSAGKFYATVGKMYTVLLKLKMEQCSLYSASRHTFILMQVEIRPAVAENFEGNILFSK
ncbi:MAG: hypothetical protein ACI94O_001132, partial [Octadecabacter sp.]